MHDWIVTQIHTKLVVRRQLLSGTDEKIEQIILSSASPSPQYGQFHASDQLVRTSTVLGENYYSI